MDECKVILGRSFSSRSWSLFVSRSRWEESKRLVFVRSVEFWRICMGLKSSLLSKGLCEKSSNLFSSLSILCLISSRGSATMGASLISRSGLVYYLCFLGDGLSFSTSSMASTMLSSHFHTIDCVSRSLILIEFPVIYRSTLVAWNLLFFWCLDSLHKKLNALGA